MATTMALAVAGVYITKYRSLRMEYTNLLDERLYQKQLSASKGESEPPRPVSPQSPPSSRPGSRPGSAKNTAWATVVPSAQV